MQIRTGEGKSLALGGCAALFALLGFRVRCICYSKYLSNRDEAAFSPLFQALQLQTAGAKQIVYSTITEYSQLAAEFGVLHISFFSDLNHGIFLALLERIPMTLANDCGVYAYKNSYNSYITCVT